MELGKCQSMLSAEPGQWLQIECWIMCMPSKHLYYLILFPEVPNFEEEGGLYGSYSRCFTCHMKTLWELCAMKICLGQWKGFEPESQLHTASLYIHLFTAPMKGNTSRLKHTPRRMGFHACLQQERSFSSILFLGTPFLYGIWFKWSFEMLPVPNSSSGLIQNERREFGSQACKLDIVMGQNSSLFLTLIFLFSSEYEASLFCCLCLLNISAICRFGIWARCHLKVRSAASCQSNCWSLGILPFLTLTTWNLSN